MKHRPPWWKHQVRNSNRPSFRVASDCSGIDVPVAVLEQLNIATHHVFSSEIDRCLRDFLQACFAPDTMYPDMTIRNNHVPRPAETDLDLYSVGLPCQPFSKSGKNLGEDDPKDGGRRGLLFYYALDFIRHKTPKALMLENVANRYFIRRKIKSLLEDNRYNIYWDIVRTDDHGIPQHSVRLYVVGIRKDVEKTPFRLPNCVP